MTFPSDSADGKDIAANRWLSIIGIGEDGVEGLTPTARRLIAEAFLVLGGQRHLALVSSLTRCKTLVWPSPIEGAFPDILARRGMAVVVLASGDPMMYGIGRALLELVPVEETLCLPQPSAFSLAAARMGWALQDVSTVTLHGRAIERIYPLLSSGRRILALSWDGSTPARVSAMLASRGFAASKITVLEAMGGPRERVSSYEPEAVYQPLNTLAIEVLGPGDKRVIGFGHGLSCELFESDGQLTKREVRAVTLSALAPRYGELLWDIGLGSGSVAIEWLLADPSLRAIGFEAREDRLVRARANAVSLGAVGLKVVLGRAPEVLYRREPPDAVFIGGGLTREGVFEAAWEALKPGGRLVANTVTIESEARLVALQGSYGGELLRIGIERVVPVGNFQGWRAAMPVTQWRVVKR